MKKGVRRLLPEFQSGKVALLARSPNALKMQIAPLSSEALLAKNFFRVWVKRGSIARSQIAKF